MAIVQADGSKTQYIYFPEATAGTPAAGAYQILRCKAGANFDLSRSTFTSQDMRSDRQQSSLSYGTKSGSITLPIEWSYGTYDDLMAAVMGDTTAAGSATWGSNILRIGNTAKTYTFEEAATDIGIVEQYQGAQFREFTISQKVNGIAEGSFSGMYRSARVAQCKGVNIAIDASAKTITRATAGFTTLDGFPAVTTGSPVIGISMKGNTDAGNNDTVWVATTITDTVMTFTTMTGAVTKATTAGITVNQATSSTSKVAATTIAPFDSFTGTITEGGTAIAHVTGWDLNVSQEMEPNFTLGSDSAQSVSTGIVSVTGTVTVYYVDQTLRKKFINGTSTALSLVLGSVSATKAYTFDLGSVKYTSNTRDNSPMARIETLNFTATYDATNTSTLKITRTP
jgi:hypothetical protein